MRKKFIIFVIFGIFLIQLPACSREEVDENIVKITYWEKWTGFEGEAMQAVVDLFNFKKLKNKEGKVIQVEMVTTSQLDRRLLTAAAGGIPSDVAGIWTWLITVYADKNALVPLNDYLEEAGMTKDDYVPIFWDICEYEGKIWALPSTPASVALHWNKRLFREAGLDPNKPPQSIQELDLMAEKLTKVELPGEEEPVTFYELKKRRNYKELLRKGKITQMGFLPSEPGWWPWSWGYWFGGRLWNKKDTITCDDKENIKAYEWIRSYSLKYGEDNIKKFSSSFGVFSSPQNPFLSAKVAMVIQGVWLYNFIDKYATGMEWGAAPFPSDEGRLKDVSYIEADALVIPRGAKHPDEAFEFIKFVNTQEGMELLCDGQRKFSPLKEVSEDFYKKHKNPYIRMFRRLAESPNSFIPPKTVIFQEYQREMTFAYERTRDLETTPKEVLEEVKNVIQRRLDRETEMKKILKESQ